MSFLDEARTKELWAKVKTSLSTKQPLLAGTAGQVVGFGADGGAQAVQGWSNPNILINADFRKPVNRNGRAEYNTKGYGLDLWYLNRTSTNLKVENGYISLTNVSSDGSSTYSELIQDVSPDINDGENVTISTLLKDGSFYSITKKVVSTSINSLEIGSPPIARLYYSKTTGRSLFNITVLRENVSELIAAKLELGTQQTLAHQDTGGNWVLNDPVDYESEYAKCAQYDPQTGKWVGYTQPVNDAANLALQSSCPTNRILYDDIEKGGTYVYIPKFRLCDVMSTEDTSIHPAFRVNGLEIPGFYFGKFQSHNYNGRAYSLPREDPSANTVTLDMCVDYNRAKGSKFHEITAAEWSAIALWCHKNGTEPKGNNGWGKDVSETLYKAVPSSALDKGRVQRVATGTGPVTWTHDGTLEGIWDMNGNVWEWCAGLRLVYGELQVIPYNDAADPACDLSVASAAWKAIKAAAASWDDLFVTPDGNGTTQGTVKLDWDGAKWVYSTTIAHATKSTNCSFASVTADASIGDQAKLLLMALTMLPDTGLTGDGIAAGYNGGHFWINNAEAERCLCRGGCWISARPAGVFSSYLYHARSRSNVDLGGRSAFID